MMPNKLAELGSSWLGSGCSLKPLAFLNRSRELAFLKQVESWPS